MLIEPTPVTPKPSRISCALARAWSDLGGASASEWPARSRSRQCRRTTPSWISPPAGAGRRGGHAGGLHRRAVGDDAWPSTRSSTTGRSATTASRSAAVGKRLFRPQFLVPADADDPLRVRDARPHNRAAAAASSASERVPGEVEPQRGEAEVHHMAVARRSARAAAFGRAPSTVCLNLRAVAHRRRQHGLTLPSSPTSNAGEMLKLPSAPT